MNAFETFGTYAMDDLKQISDYALASMMASLAGNKEEDNKQMNLAIVLAENTANKLGLTRQDALDVMVDVIDLVASVGLMAVVMLEMQPPTIHDIPVKTALNFSAN